MDQEFFRLISKKNYNEDEELDKVIDFILKGASIEYKSKEKGSFPLLICSRKNYLQTFIVLLKAGANVNQSNHYLTTSTMAAARHGNKEILELLILKKADVNARCLDGDNAIMSAKRHDQVECFDMLVKASSYLNNRNLANQTLIDLPSEVNFDLSKISLTSLSFSYDFVSFENTQDLVEEAIKKMKKIK